LAKACGSANTTGNAFCCANHRPTWRSPWARNCARLGAKSRCISAITGCLSLPFDAVQAKAARAGGASGAFKAEQNCWAKSSGNKGASQGTVSNHSVCIFSRPASTPAKGPIKGMGEGLLCEGLLEGLIKVLAEALFKGPSWRPI